jgi:hypothetical protein
MSKPDSAPAGAGVAGDHLDLCIVANFKQGGQGLDVVCLFINRQKGT